MDWFRYSPIDDSDAIDCSSRLFHERNTLWNLPLVTQLTRPEPQCTHAVVWDERCIRRLLPIAHTPHRESLVRDMDSLVDFRNWLAHYEEFSTKAEEIWYRHPARDQIQTAVAQFYWAVAHELYPNGTRPITILGVGVSVIAQGEGFPGTVLRVAIEEFVYVAQQRASRVTPAQMLNLKGADYYGFRQRTEPNG